MYLVSNEEMRQLDRTAIETWRISSLVLMENAGIAILRQLERDVPGLYEKRITILCGCGNNGGDGLVLARQLHLAGAAQVAVVIVIDGERRFSADHQANRDILERLPVKIIEVDGLSRIGVLKAQLNFSDIAVDCLFGTGLSRDLGELSRAVCDVLNDKRILRVARRPFRLALLATAARSAVPQCGPTIPTPSPGRSRAFFSAMPQNLSASCAC